MEEDTTPLLDLQAVELRPLLKLNDELRALLAEEKDMNVTTIVAVGDQSHGKTSVVEALSGIDLPRGEGIQTRLPLELRLRKVDSKGEERATIQVTGKKDMQPVELDEVGEVVRRLTEELAPGKNVVNSPLILTVYKCDHEDLTLVDLPGMTRVAVDGQDKDIGKEIAKMYDSYMSQPETIMLNVVIADVDCTTSEALQMSLAADKEQNRTILCLTKIDKVNDGSLEGKIESIQEKFKWKIPVFAVRNRTQVENDEHVALSEARRLERECIDGLLPNLSDDVKGIEALSKRLVQLQLQSIKRTLPRLFKKLQRAEAAGLSELAQYPTVPKTEEEATVIIQQALNRILSKLRAHADGDVAAINQPSKEKEQLKTWTWKYSGDEDVWHSNSSEAGEDIQMILRANQVNQVNRSVSPKFSLYYRSATITNATVLVSGYKSSDDDEEAVFEEEVNLEKDQTKQLSVKMNGCNTLVVQLLKPNTEATQVTTMMCARFSRLEEEFAIAVRKIQTQGLFLSTPFGDEVRQVVASMQGGTGLPDTIAPSVAVLLLGKLQAVWHPLANKLIDESHAIVEKTIASIVDEYCQYCDNLREELHRLTKQAIGRQVEILTKGTETLLKMEKRVATRNHYYMQTVTKIRSTKYENGYPPGLSNEDQAVLELQIRIAAYWKLSCKRVVDNVTQLVHLYLIREPILEYSLEDELSQLFQSQHLVRLASPCADSVEKITRLKSRVGSLQSGIKSIKEALNSLV